MAAFSSDTLLYSLLCFPNGTGPQLVDVHACSPWEVMLQSFFYIISFCVAWLLLWSLNKQVRMYLQSLHFQKLDWSRKSPLYTQPVKLDI